jgi:hypothetical protein
MRGLCRSAAIHERVDLIVMVPGVGPQFSSSLIRLRTSIQFPDTALGFPCSLLQGITAQYLENASFFGRIEGLIQQPPLQFPVFFPVTREQRAETGSLETPPSSSESIANLPSLSSAATNPLSGRRAVLLRPSLWTDPGARSAPPPSDTPSTWCAVDACDGRRMGKVGPTSARSRTSRHPLCG